MLPSLVLRLARHARNMAREHVAGWRRTGVAVAPVFTFANTEQCNAQLIRACAEGDTYTAQDALDRGANPNVALGNNDQIRPLHRVVSRGYWAIGEALLCAGANIDARDKHGRTPLFYVAHPGRADETLLPAATWLLEHGANPDAIDDYGRPLLHQLLEKPALCKLFVQHGVNLAAKDADGMTALDLIVTASLTEQSQAVLCQLVRAGATTKYGLSSVAHILTKTFFPDVAELMLEQNMQPALRAAAASAPNSDLAVWLHAWEAQRMVDATMQTFAAVAP